MIWPRGPVLARAPLALAQNLDAGAVDEKVQGASVRTVRDVDDQPPLAPAQRAEVRHRPVQARQLQQARHQPFRLSQGQPKQRLQRQAGLDRRIAEGFRATTAAFGHCQPVHLRIEPDK